MPYNILSHLYDNENNQLSHILSLFPKIAWLRASALTLALVSGGTDESEDKWVNNYADLCTEKKIALECNMLCLL